MFRKWTGIRFIGRAVFQVDEENGVRLNSGTLLGLLADSFRNMPSFTFLARDAGTGREIRSSLDAASEEQAVAALLGRNLLVINIQEKAGRRGKTAGGSVPWPTLSFSPASWRP